MNLASILESILFAAGDPVGLKKLSALADVPEAEARKALADLEDDYKHRGLALVQKDGAYQLGTRPENSSFIERLKKSARSEDLSRASLETAAIIAYKGPVTRADIEYIRGVNCSFALQNLLLRGLIEREERPGDARAYVYRVSMEFLKHLGIANTEDLPGYAELKNESAAVMKEMKEEL